MKDLNLHDISTFSPPVGVDGEGMQILVFRTSLKNNSHIKKIGVFLSQHPGISEWNVDLHDCDKILRVVTKNISPAEIEVIVLSAGYFCEELK